jgi:hypothetical protein
VATAVTLPISRLFILFTTPLVVSLKSLGAVSATLIGRVAVVDKNKSLKGLSILRRLSLPNPVLPYPIPYSLSQSLLESYARFLRFFNLVAFFWPFWIASSIAVM